MSKILKARDPQFYESFLNRLEKITPTINTLAVDQSLKQLNDDVFSILLPLMKERETGLYNNDFENVCKNLILVSAFRGNDIQDNTKELSVYLTEKNNLYDIVKEIGSIHGNAKQVLQQKHEIEEKLKEIIKALRNK